MVLFVPDVYIHRDVYLLKEHFSRSLLIHPIAEKDELKQLITKEKQSIPFDHN
jgi:hypothetical protein